MDRVIRIEINGSYVTKDNNVAGVQGEGNSTIMNIIFDEGWGTLAKTITFYNAKGLNPVEIVLTTDLLTDITTSTLDYSVPIPSEPLEFGGEMSFVVDGYVDNTRQRSATGTLAVKFSATAGTPATLTPTQVEQFQAQYEEIMQTIQDSAISAQESKSYAVGGTGSREGEDTDNAKYYKEQAAISEENAGNSEQAASDSEKNAKTSEENALKHEGKAKSASEEATRQAQAASNSASAAATSAQAAVDSASAAKTSETNAAQSEAKALDYSKMSESYAVGDTGVRSGENTDNSKYYSEQSALAAGASQQSAQNAANSETAAGNAKVAAQVAQTAAETAQKGAEAAKGEIDQRFADIDAILDEINGEVL